MAIKEVPIAQFRFMNNTHLKELLSKQEVIFITEEVPNSSTASKHTIKAGVLISYNLYQQMFIEFNKLANQQAPGINKLFSKKSER